VRFRSTLLAYLQGQGYLAAYKQRRVALAGSGSALVALALLGGGYGV